MEVSEGSLAQKIEQTRCRLDHAQHGRVLGVQNPQRVAVQPAFGLIVQQVSVLFQMCNQGGAVSQPLGGLAQAVELKAHIIEAQFLPKRIGQEDQFSINLSTGKTQHLGANLVKLPVTATLRALVAKHRPHVIQTFATFIKHVVLDHGAHHAGRALGPQSELLAIQAVLEGIHFLLDDVCDLTQAAHKQGGGLDDGRTDVAVGITRHQVAHFGLQPLPARGVRWQHIVHALDTHQLLGFGRLGAVFWKKLAHFFSVDPEPKRFSM